MKGIRFVAVAALCALAGRASAQEPPPPGDDQELRQRLNELERRLDEQARELDALRARDPGQQPPGQTPASEKHPIEWAWKDGFYVHGEWGGAKYELRPIGRIQLDYRVFARNDPNEQIPHPVPEDQFLIRRARVGFSGAFGDFGFVLEADPDRGGIKLGVAYLQWQTFQELRVQLGHFRTPFALENGMMGTNQHPLLERSMIIGSGNAAAPGFSPGAMVWGTLAKAFSYYVSAQNRVDSNQQVTSDPLLGARLQLEVQDFMLGASGVMVRQGGGVQDSVTGLTPAQYRFFNAVSVEGQDLRGGVDVSWFHGPLFAMAEYAYLEQERRRVLGGRDGSPFAVQGAYVAAGFVFWGPDRDQPHALPLQNWTLLPDLDRPRKGRFAGAELVLRLEWMSLDDRNGGRGFEANGAASSPSRAAGAGNIKGTDARALSLGFNLFPIENVRFSVQWSHVRVGDHGRAPDDSSRWQEEVILRGQIDF